MQPELADRYPLAPLQRGMLFHALAAPESTMYVEQYRHVLAGELDLTAFRAAWEAVCERHPVLRTGFDWADGDRPGQAVWSTVELPLVVADWRDRPEPEQAAQLRQLESSERERGFDLAQAPLFRLRLVRLGDRAWQLLWTYHHLILDGWSAGIVFHDVATAYAAAERGEKVSLPAAPPYRDFVDWAGSQDLDRAREYWTGVLAGFTEPTSLGIARTARPQPPGSGSPATPPQRLGRALPRELRQRLDRFARTHAVTVDTLLTGAWAVVLGRYAGTDDVVFGVTSTGRDGQLPGLEQMVGLLINTVPARVRLDGSRPVGQWLVELQQERARELALTPLDRVQAWSELPAGRRLFDSILVVEDFPYDQSRRSQLGGLRVTESEAVQQTNYPLTLLAFPQGTEGRPHALGELPRPDVGGELPPGLVMEALFDARVLDPQLVRRLLGHLETVLAGFVAGSVLDDVELMPPPERTELVARGAPRASFPPQDTDLAPARFAAWAEQADRVAVSYQDQQVSYGDLRARVAGLAHRLRGLGVGPGALVGICLPRGVDLVVAVLAVACAGGGYVPVDRRDPAARVRAVLADAAPAVLLTCTEVARELGPGDLPTAVVLDDPSEQEHLASLPDTLPPRDAQPHDLAYVIFTSGSTGTPKGVAVEHAQLARLFDATRDWFQPGPADVWTLFHSIAFDFSVWELWGALAHGGRLVVVTDDLTRDPTRFRELLLAEGVTVLNQTPSSFRALMHADLAAAPAPYRLRCVIFGGEMLEVSNLRPWLERYGDQQPRLVNMYGITETTVHVTYRPISRADLAAGVPSPIGEPIPDLAVRLVDPRGRLVPVGVPGELHVGGAGVARGYLHRPELTADRFIDAAAPRIGRWYRTGDRARWLTDGGLEFLGRVDDQVKIRGYRIELGEIESVLNGHPQVRESVVVARETGTDGHRQLVAYVVPAPEGASTTYDLRSWLSERVPDYLVPAGFVSLDRLPLTPNGKVDRAALPDPLPARPDEGDVVAPRTDVERVLVEVWAEVLGLEQVGTTDNFFALGGDSILTIQVVSRASRRGVSITPAQLFAHQTVAGLAQVAAPTGQAVVEAEQGEVTGEVPVTPAQAWFHRLALPHAGQWNLPVLLEARQPVRIELLTQALTALVAHHDLLRLRVVDEQGQQRQRIVPVAATCPVPVQEVDLPAIDRHRLGAQVDELARAVQGGLHLEQGPLLQGAVFRAPPGEPDRVLLVAHHLVVDTVSWRILLEDLGTAYQQLAEGQPVQLPAKTTDFATWARHLAEVARSNQVAEEASWWLTGLPPRAPSLPVEGDRDAPSLEGDAGVVEATLDEPATQQLLTPANVAYRTRTEELLLAALAQAMAGWTRIPQLLVDVEGHGRDVELAGVDVTRTVGWFTTFTPTWLDLSEVGGRVPPEVGERVPPEVGGRDPAKVGRDPAAVIKTVKEQLRAMPGRGAAHGLARWLRDDDLSRRLSELPQAEVSFNYLGRLDQGAPAPAGFALAPELVSAARHPANPRPYLIDVIAGVREGRLHLYLAYTPRHHSQETVDRLAQATLEALRSIIDHCVSPGAGGPTPSDFPLAQVDQGQLDRLVDEHGPLADLYPLAPLQRGLLFHTLANPSSGVYFEQFSLGLDGPLDMDAFARTWRALLDRHEVLRAGVAWQGLAVPHLVVREQVELSLTYHDWSGLAEAAGPLLRSYAGRLARSQAAQLEQLLAEDRTRGFDLTDAPLTRLYLVRLAPERWHLVWSHHHLLLDGWSVALLIQEVFDTYEAMRAGSHVPAPPPRPYRDYIAYLAGLDFTGAWAYWRRVLSGVTGPTPLGADRPELKTGRRDADYARVHRRLPPSQSEELRELARGHRLTLDTVLHGAWALLLAHRSGLDDVVFGVASSGRPPALAGVEEMVGLFINTLPARVKVDRDQPVGSWLAGLLRDQVQARELEHTPLDQIRSWTSVPPDLPLFDSGRGLENYPMDGSRYRTGSVTIREIRTFEQSNYALSFIVVPDDALLLQLWYDALRFAPETADHMLQTVEALVLALAADPERTVGEVLAQLPAPVEVQPSRQLEPAADLELGRVAHRLRELPMVSEAVVVPTADGRRLAAYLLPDTTVLARDGGATSRLAQRHVEDWRTLYDQTYAAAQPADPTFNIVGWSSSYTGLPIAPDAMAEWRARTIERIRALGPGRILEIGCGPGLLLFGLLEECDHYIGTDFSPVCLAQVRDHLATRDAATRAKVTLLERTADDVTGLEPDSFDVVLLNSVVQYFPGSAYLARVLDGAIRVAAPDGAIFLGDLRHHGLREAFHVSVELHHAVDLLPTHELHGRVDRSLGNERELLVDPAYVVALTAERPEVGAVEVMPKRGTHDTELTRYRYDAVLRLGTPPPDPGEVTWYDWRRDVLSRSEIGWLLDNAEEDAVGVTGVPNARVAADVEAARLLGRTDVPGTAGELRPAAGKAPPGVDPEELYQLGEQRGWAVAVSWAAHHTDGRVNVLFRRGPDRAAGAAALHAAGPEGDGEAWTSGLLEAPLINTPLRGSLAGDLERQAWEALPEDANVSRVLIVDDLPRTADGRVDVAALPVVADAEDAAGPIAGGTVPPRTADELTLARIWEQALRVREVDVRTSFFDLGGDSLLAIRVIDEAAQALGRDVPLAVLLQQPTIEGMAAALRGDRRPWTPLVEITQGKGTPFFCVHPAGGGVLCYAELARQLGPGQPFCALQARGVEGDDQPYDDLPTMAARYLADVRGRQATGPYLLGGWSMGGLVAYEMAQQLVAAGERVGLLALIETPTPELVVAREPALPDEAAVLAQLLEGVVDLDLAQLRAMPARERLEHVLAEAERAHAVPPGMDPDRAQHLFEVYTTHLEAVRRYQARPYGGRTCLFRAAQTDVTAADSGWGGLLTGAWEMVEVPGSHETVVWPPHVQRLAEVLRAQLAA